MNLDFFGWSTAIVEGSSLGDASTRGRSRPRRRCVLSVRAQRSELGGANEACRQRCDVERLLRELRGPRGWPGRGRVFQEDDHPGLVDAGSAYPFQLSGPAGTYCTAGTSASGCQASISSFGMASASASFGFYLIAIDRRGREGRHVLLRDEWPAKRSPGATARASSARSRRCSARACKPAAEPSEPCDGSFAQDLNALWCPICPKPPSTTRAGCHGPGTTLVPRPARHLEPEHEPLRCARVLRRALTWQPAPVRAPAVLRAIARGRQRPGRSGSGRPRAGISVP